MTDTTESLRKQRDALLHAARWCLWMMTGARTDEDLALLRQAIIAAEGEAGPNPQDDQRLSCRSRNVLASNGCTSAAQLAAAMVNHECVRWKNCGLAMRIEFDKWLAQISRERGETP